MSKHVSKKKKKQKKSKKYNPKKAQKKLNKKLGKAYKVKHLKGNLDKKDVKELNKALKKTTEIRVLEESRERCNHHIKRKFECMTVTDFREQYPERIHLVPFLDILEKMFDGRVGVCPHCLRPVIQLDDLNTEKVNESIAYLYAAINTLRSSDKIDKKALKLLYKTEKQLVDNCIFIRKRVAKVAGEMASGKRKKTKFIRASEAKIEEQQEARRSASAVGIRSTITAGE